MPATILFIIAGIFVPALLVVVSSGKSEVQSLIALSAGASAFSMMALNLFLAARPIGVERWVGGLDRLYRLHKWFGIAILFLICVHRFVGMQLDGLVVSQSLAAQAAQLGNLMFIPLVALILSSWIKRLPKIKSDLIPYQVWRWVHRLLGIVFLVLVVHQLFVRVPFSNSDLVA